LGNRSVQVNLTLDKPSLASLAAGLTTQERTAYAAEIEAYQQQVAEKISAAGGRVLHRFRTISSGLIVEMPGRIAPQVAEFPEVERISQIHNYQIDLTETVPYIGAAAFTSSGVNGNGVKVAVLDSGIDYTHLAFGGPGTISAWETAYYGTPSCQTSFGQIPGCANSQAPNPAQFGPSAPRVKGGYDFVGPVWTGSGSAQLRPDPNPIANHFGGDGDGTHGTHVADIIGGSGYPAGSNADGAYQAKGPGVAPGVDLYAFTVCSSVSTACSGVAILQGMDAAADLDGNPATKDPVDIVNLSLGTIYGQPESDDAYLVNELTRYGVIVVTSAGNSGDKPYVVGSPSLASGAISVAQTTLPSEKYYPIQSTGLASAIISIRQPWSGAISNPISGELAYDNTDINTQYGCISSGDSPWSGTPFAGKVLLVYRGSCAVSLKVANGEAAGAIAVIVGNNQPAGLYDLPPSFTDGGGSVSIPGLVISQNDYFNLAVLSGQTVTIPAGGSPLNDTVAPTSSRGPRNHDLMIKPDIAAPGASTSAISGSGAATTAFGGTSGAAPMIAGAAALLKDYYNDGQNFGQPFLSPQQYKALLMNTANTQIYKNGVGGYLAPITRIGGGQVDLAKAFGTDFIAWDSTGSDPLNWTGSMSFSYQPVTEIFTATRKLTIRNMFALGKDYLLDYDFRYANDNGKGVSLQFDPPLLHVPGGSSASVDVTLTIDLSQAANLPVWPYEFNRGFGGYNGYTLDLVEVDGYITVSRLLVGSVDRTITVPFHVLPKAVADPNTEKVAGANQITLSNLSTYVASYTDIFALVDQNPNDYNYTIGDCGSIKAPPGCNITPIDIKEVGVAYDPNLGGPSSPGLLFGMTVWDQPARASQFPVEFDIYIDNNLDNVWDYAIWNYDLSSGSDGRNVVKIQARNSSTIIVPYYTVSNFNSNNWILPVPLNRIGVDPDKPFGFRVNAVDGYFTGQVWDASPSDNTSYHRITPNKLRYELSNYADTSIQIPPFSSGTLTYTERTIKADAFASGSQIGFLFLYTDAPLGRESTAIVLGERIGGLVYIPEIRN
jgi:subtilisin family serine protease